MDITIRRAEKRDCVRLLELIQELAEYEKAPNEVTVTLSHFEESGFGANPVWWGFVAEVAGVVVDQDRVEVEEAPRGMVMSRARSVGRWRSEWCQEQHRWDGSQ